jgi:hypothetical protein
MAGDWSRIDHDTPDKPEVLGIVEITGESVEVVFFRLFLLWRLADRQTENGVLCGIGPRSLAARLGGTPEFWEAVANVGWLIFDGGNAIIPKFSEVFGASAKRRMMEAKRKQCGYSAEKKRRNSPQASGEKSGNSVEGDADNHADPVSVSVSVSKPESESEQEKTQKRWKATPVEEIPIPAALDCEEFRAVWASWQQHRMEIKKKLTPTSVKAQFAELEAMGISRAIAAIRLSIKKGWHGIFEENGESRNGNGKHQAIGPGQRHPADAIRSGF